MIAYRSRTPTTTNSEITFVYSKLEHICATKHIPQSRVGRSDTRISKPIDGMH